LAAIRQAVVAEDQPFVESEELRGLIAAGAERGYLTFEEIASTLEEVEVTKEQVSELHSHLVEQGHKAIAHIMGPPITHAKRRADGYKAALKELGARTRAEWIVRAGFMEADGYRAAKKLLSVKPRIDAIFATNDPTAIGAMKAIWDAGLRVPDDIAIVGAGDIALGDLLRVPLTTVSWSRDEQGKLAAKLLLDQIGPEPSDQFRSVVIPPHLIVRRSSAGE